MTDWREAGLKADARRIQRLWTQPFDNPAKAVVRQRVASVLKISGGTVCLDLGGGGTSARLLSESGLSVISVENGSLRLDDGRGLVSQERKRRAHLRICEEIGVEPRWGHAHQFAAEADVAFLDFCGPWSADVRRAVEACQHMKAVAVTLMTDHDINTGATDQRERMLAYIAWLKNAYRPKESKRVLGEGKTFRATPCKLIAHYKRSSGQPVWVFLLSAKYVKIPHLTNKERYALHPEQYAADIARTTIRTRERWQSDPEWRAQRYAYQLEWRRKNKAKVAEYDRRTRAKKQAA